ncbi:hypothetical protein [Dyadobacter sp. CY312]|uniref:hypothetical protein n=1 Tax=Dyadobacter sp. CY312 TaxID=2907303 RepID=UPI001F48AB99|nr:hypothetical protein [Dyadobacter sp. CY312]MCE7044641.1 hypothetical protein [Dyadobacter sp. CY312]
MKKIIQYLRFSAIIVGTVAILAGKNASAQTCTNTVTSYPGTANGVIINYYGGAFFHNGTPVTCGQSAPSTSQFYGDGATLTSGTYVFSSPVNDIVFWVGGMHDTPADGVEKVVWSTNGGNTSVTSSNYCLGILSDSTFTSSGSQSSDGSNSAGGVFVVHADSPFTKLTLEHTQGNTDLNGASVLLCSGSVVSCFSYTPVLSAVTQPTCATPTGSFTITNYDPTLTYTVTPEGSTTPTAVTIDPTGLVSGVPYGVPTDPYSSPWPITYYVTAFNAPNCGSATAISESVQPAPQDCCPADAGTITRQ